MIYQIDEKAKINRRTNENKVNINKTHEINIGKDGIGHK